MSDQPKQLGIAPKEPVIYTIPEQFYGLAAKAQLPKEVAAPAAPGVPAAPAAPVAPTPPQKGSKAWILIPVIAVLLLVGIGFGIWTLMKPKKAPAPTQPSVTLPTTPAPQPAPEPVPAPEPEPVPEPATTTPEVPTAPLPSADEDGDNLTTAEETLFGTDAKKSDTDTDGFADDLELTNLYNPAGFKPTKLVEAGLVTPYEGVSYSILRPATWKIGAPGKTADDLEVQDASTNDFFTVSPVENPGNQALLDWYLTLNPSVSPADVQQSNTKSGLETLRGPDIDGNVNAYVHLGEGKIFRLSYSQGPAGYLYRSTFTMFLNSFSAKP